MCWYDEGHTQDMYTSIHVLNVVLRYVYKYIYNYRFAYSWYYTIMSYSWDSVS